MKIQKIMMLIMVAFHVGLPKREQNVKIEVALGTTKEKSKVIDSLATCRAAAGEVLGTI